jgi:hypothetical protein
MDLTNNSTIETVIEFANVKFGMEIPRDGLVEQLKNLSFSETLKLINSMKADDNDAFAEIIDLSAFNEGVVEVDEVDEVAEEDNTELHRLRELSGYTNEWVQDSPAQGFSGQERNFIEELCLRMDGVSRSPDGLKWMGKSETWNEGNVLSDKGKLTTVMIWAKRNKDDLYHKMGSEFKVYSDGNDEGDSGRGQSDGDQIIQNIINKVGKIGEDSNLEEYGTISTAQPSRATIRAGKENNDVANRRSNNINQDMNRDSKVPNRTVAGANKQPTGTGASRAGSADPDDIHRQEIEDLAAQGQGQSNVNAQEIERLKQLAMGG